MMHKLISYYGFSRMPFGRDLAPGMLHRHSAHNEAVATPSSTCPTPPSASRASTTASSPRSADNPSPTTPPWPHRPPTR